MGFVDTKEAIEASISELNKVVSKLQAISVPSDDTKRLISQGAKIVRDADNKLKEMERELKAAVASDRRQAATVFSNLKSQLNNAKGSFKAASEVHSRGELFGNAKDARLAQQTGDTLVRSAETAQAGTSKLMQIQSMVNETTDIGINVLGTMEDQRESLLRSTDKAKATNEHTTVARRILLGIQARTVTNKGILVFIALLLMGCIGVVVYFGFIKSPRQ